MSIILDAQTHKMWQWICCFSFLLFLTIIISQLILPKMFFDGVIYASLARNLVSMPESLWHLTFTQTMLNPFYEHPPLAIYFESLFFKLFGPGIITERIYILVLIACHLGMISYYWLKTQKSFGLSVSLLLLFWLYIPLNWKFTHNYLIATLSLFTCAASLLLLVPCSSRITAGLKYFLSAMLIVLAFHCDGPVAFFPLAIPMIHTLVYKPNEWLKGCLSTLGLLIILLTVFLLFYAFNPAALDNTKHFFAQQVLASLNGSRDDGFSGLKHLYIFILFLKAYGGAFVIGSLTVVIAAKIEGKPIIEAFKNQFQNKPFLLFLLITLAAVLPIGISFRQSFRYLLPSTPFFTLAMMYFSYPSLEIIIHRLSPKSSLYRTWAYGVLLIPVLGMGYVIVDFYRSIDWLRIKDLHQIANYCMEDQYCSKNGLFTIDDYHVLYNASFYLARYTPLISTSYQKELPYFLGDKDSPIPAGYHPIDLQLKMYHFAQHDGPLTALNTTIVSPMQDL